MAFFPPAFIKLYALLYIFLSAALVQAGPAALGGVLAFNPQSIQTTFHTTDSNGNPVLQVCTVRLTPTTVNGEDDVIVVYTCIQTPDTGGGEGGTSTTTNEPTLTTTPGLSEVASISITTAVSTDGSTSPSSSVSTPTSTTSTSGTPTISGATNLSTSLSNTTSSASGASATLTNTDSSVAGTSSTTTVSPVGVISTGLPGRSISVLPIGLGIFAGLAIIAMIIVGAVTYERTKYRKNFRAQRLAEAGEAMAYGGMAQSRI